jgi:hypothetical protein
MKSYHHGNLKKELLTCALKMCERDGYTKLSIRSLAKESNVSQTAPYRHFKTKEELYAAVATEGFNKLYKVMSKSKSKDHKKNLISSGKEYINFGLKNSNTYDLMFGTAIADFTKYPSLFISANKLYRHIRTLFSAYSKNKNPEFIEEKCIGIWAHLHGLIGLLRKLEVVPAKLIEMPDAPFMAVNKINEDLDLYLSKFIRNI